MGIHLLVRNLYIANNRKPTTQIGLKVIKLIGSSNCNSRNKAFSKVSWICGRQLCFGAVLSAVPFCMSPRLAFWWKIAVVLHTTPPGEDRGFSTGSELKEEKCISPKPGAVSSSYDSNWVTYLFLKQSLWLGDFHVLIGFDLRCCSQLLWWAWQYNLSEMGKGEHSLEQLGFMGER